MKKLSNKKSPKVTPKRSETRKAPAKSSPSKPPKSSKPARTQRATKAAEPAPAQVEAAPIHEPVKAPEPPPPPQPLSLEELDIEGAAINGVHLKRCVQYAAKVCPKEDGDIYFTHDDSGRALVSSHDLKRSHTGYLVEDAAMHCNIAVPREEAVAFAKLLDGLSNPVVRIDALGNAVVRHDPAQRPIPFTLGCRPITQHWQPPSQAGRVPAAGPLRLSASAKAAAVKWPAAVVYEFESRDGIAWLNVSDAETGTLLARAVIAEDGKELYAADERQTEFPGTRTVVAPAPKGPVEPLPEKPAETVERVEPEAVERGAVTIEANGETVTIEGAAPLRGAALEGALGDLERWAADANASGVVAAETVPAPAFPEPDTKDVVISIPTVVWDELSPDALEKLHLPPGVTSTLSWFTGQTHTETAVLTADSARAVGRVCEELGLVCADVTAGRRYGIECTVWTVGRAAPKGGV